MFSHFLLVYTLVSVHIWFQISIDTINYSIIVPILMVMFLKKYNFVYLLLGKNNWYAAQCPSILVLVHHFIALRDPQDMAIYTRK